MLVPSLLLLAATLAAIGLVVLLIATFQGFELPSMQSEFWMNTWPDRSFWYDLMAKIGGGTLPGSPYFPAKFQGALFGAVFAAGAGWVAALVLFGSVRAKIEDEKPVFFIKHDDLKRFVIQERKGFIATIILSEKVTLALDGKTLEITRQFKEGTRYERFAVGDKISRVEGEALKSSQLGPYIEKLFWEARSLEDQAKKLDVEFAREEAERRERELAEEALRQKEAEKAAALRRVAGLGLKDAASDPKEPFLFLMPSPWRPIKIVGLARANMASFASTQDGQIIYRPGDGPPQTTFKPGKPSIRGVSFTGDRCRLTVNQALDLFPSDLSYTQTGDLCIVVVDDQEHVVYVYNQARREELYRSSELVRLLIDKIKPELQLLFKHYMSGGHRPEDGWA